MIFGKRNLLFFGVFLAIFVSQTALAQQYARPDGTDVAGTWSAIGAATLHGAVNEDPASNAEYITSDVGGTTSVTLSLDPLSDPGGANLNDHIITYYCQSTVGTKPKGGEGCNVELLQNGSPIASSPNNTATRGSFGLLTLTIADATAITDYTALQVRFTPSVDSDESIQISWVQLEVPGATAAAPDVTALAASNILDTSANLNGQVTNANGATITAVGFYFDTDSVVQTTTPSPASVPNPETDPFSLNVGSLSPGTTYWYKAYATNSEGTTISSDPATSFTTLNIPTLATRIPEAITTTTADLGGNVTADGGANVTEYGIEWTTDASFVTGITRVTFWTGSGFTGTYVSTVGDGTPAGDIALPTGTTVYFRAYAINSIGTGYSSTQSFIPSGPPEVTTTPADVGQITQNSAVLGGNVTSDGGGTVSDYGVYYILDPGVPTDGTKVSMGSGTGIFFAGVGGLDSGATYNFAAYADNGTEVVGSTEAFTTLAGPPTIDATPTLNNIKATTADLGGNVTADGGAAVTERGIWWHTVSPPEVGGTKVAMGSGTGPFSSTVGDGTPAGDGPLPTGTLVYFRAYATNSEGTAYSDIVPFTPQGAPEVTSSVTNITHNSAQLGGNVTSDGGSAIIERGVWYGTSSDPVNTGTKVVMGSGTGLFSQVIPSLASGQTYYFTAYASNSSSTGYSHVSPASDSFVTFTQPTVQATGVIIDRISAKGMRIRWTRGNGDGSLVVVRERDTTSAIAPTDTTDYFAQLDYSLAPTTGTGNFVVYKGSGASAIVYNLSPETWYSVEVYEYAGASPDYIQGSPAYGENTTGAVAMHNLDFGVNCDDCHNGHTGFRPVGDDLKVRCEGCHSEGGRAEAKMEFDNHLTPGSNPDIDVVDCGMCHEVHNINVLTPPTTPTQNTTFSTNFVTGATQTNKSFLRSNVNKYVPNAAAPAYLHTDQPKRAEGYTGGPEDPDGPLDADTPDRAVEGGNHTTARGYCQVCHTNTKYHRSTGTEVGLLLPDGITQTTEHSAWASLQEGPPECHDGTTDYLAAGCGDGLGELPENLDGSEPQVHCGECHQHNNKFIGSGGSVSCVICHAPGGVGVGGSNNRPAITTQFDRNSTHITGGSTVVTQADCAVCHEQSGHTTGIVAGYDLDTGASYSQVVQGADTLAAGQGSIFAPHCLSCHDDGSADTLAASGSDQTQTSPFTGSAAPPVINETHWATSGHNGPVTCVGDGQTGCHASGHGSQSSNLLANWNGGVGDPANNTAAAVLNIAQTPRTFCMNCHDGTIADNATGGTGVTIETQFGPQTNAAYQISSSDYATVNQQHDVFPADQSFSGQTEANFSCKNCHEPHVNGASVTNSSGISLNSVANPDSGLPLPNYIPTATFTGNNTDGCYGSACSDPPAVFSYGTGTDLNVVDPKGTGWQETDTIEFCLVCHDGRMPNGIVMPAGMINMAASWVGDQHGAHSDRATTKGWLKYPFGTAPQTLPNPDADYDGTTPYSAMNCTTCHGAHGSENIFNLKSSITVAGVQMTTGTSHGTFTADAGLTEYFFPVDSRSGLPELVGWGAWCSFCHDVNHDTKTGLGCQAGHMHGAGSNGNF